MFDWCQILFADNQRKIIISFIYDFLSCLNVLPISGGSLPDRICHCAGFFMTPSARTTQRVAFPSQFESLQIERCVCAPQYLSDGTSRGPGYLFRCVSQSLGISGRYAACRLAKPLNWGNRYCGRRALGLRKLSRLTTSASCARLRLPSRRNVLNRQIVRNRDLVFIVLRFKSQTEFDRWIYESSTESSGTFRCSGWSPKLEVTENANFRHFERVKPVLTQWSSRRNVPSQSDSRRFRAEYRMMKKWCAPGRPP